MQFVPIGRSNACSMHAWPKCIHQASPVADWDPSHCCIVTSSFAIFCDLKPTGYNKVCSSTEPGLKMPSLYKKLRAKLKPKSTPSRPTSSQASTPAIPSSSQQSTPNESRLSNVTCEPPAARSPKPTESLQVPSAAPKM